MENTSEANLAELLTLHKEVDRHGFIRYYNANGVLSRRYGPALTYKPGDEEWWLDGKLHRVGGPAVITDEGDKHWFQNDVRHRLDGPAVECADGHKQWWEYGQFIRRESS